MTPRTSPPKCTGATITIGATTATGVIIGIIIAIGTAGNTGCLCASELRQARKPRACLAWLMSPSGERSHEDIVRMKTWIGGAVLAAGLALVGPVAPAGAAAANSKARIHASQASEATDLSARRRTRHVRHYAYRANDRPYYYDRP